jgi:nicotinamide mononucleotide transporter
VANRARLYADSALQVVYIALGFAGWWQWLHRGQARGRLVVTRSRRGLLAACMVFVLVATWGLTVVLRAAHDIAPFWDALTTTLSLSAQFLLNAKKIENWAFWIAADLIYVPLYVVKRLDLTAIVYVLFLGMCVGGVGAWRRGLVVGGPAGRAAAFSVGSLS